MQEILVNYEGITKTSHWAERKQRGKNEINIAVLKEAKSGYIWNVMLNEGNKMFEKKQLMILLTGLEYKGYTLYMDNAFTSVSFLTELKSKHIAGCGITTERNLRPPPDTKKEMNSLTKIGETGYFRNKDLNVVVWNHHSKKVFAMSNFTQKDTVTIKKSRKIGYFSKIEYKIYEYEAPKIIHDIIENLKGDDYVNKGVSYYSLDYSSWKWYYRVMLYFLEMCMMNSYVLYSKVLTQKGISPISNLEFRMEIIKRLCKWNEKTGMNEKEKNGLIEKNANATEENQENEKVEDEKEKKTVEIKKSIDFDDVIITNNCKLVYIGVGFCHYCRSKRLKLKKTLFWCKECQIGLCIKCFDQHKSDQILKTLKDLEPSYMKHLIDMLIINKDLQAEGITTNAVTLTKRFRKSKNEQGIEDNDVQIIEPNQKEMKPVLKLKRKRAP